MCMTFGGYGNAVTRPKTVVVATLPRVEPITLTEAKEHLRILPEYADDDPYVMGLITAARRVAEETNGFSWALKQYRAKVCGCIGCACSCGCDDAGIELPNPPLFVDADHPIAITTPDGLVPDEDFEVDADRWPALVIPLRGWRGPATITYWAGVPAGVQAFDMARTAALQLVGHWYRNREAVGEQVLTKVPFAVEHLLGLERQAWRL